MSNPEWLERAARRSQSETWMLGHTFERYRELEGCSLEELAKELGCTMEALHWLSLCRHPEGQDFNEQAAAIANHFAVELLPLVQVLRRVEVMNALSRQEGAGELTEEPSMQLAARDRSDDGEMSS
jgi:transcriptional regulator with XRE-family HTH domain